jgi:protein TonB
MTLKICGDRVLPLMFVSLVTVAATFAVEKIDSGLVEQLDVVEVSASRIVRLPRFLPMPMPHLSTATPLPPDVIRSSRTPLRPILDALRSPRVFFDDTAAAEARRTRVRYLDTGRTIYPRRAREMGWEGTVVLQVSVNTDGSVTEVTVEQTSGHALLDQAAVVAARSWRFVPQIDGMFPMPSIVEVPVRFDLKEQEVTP